MTVKEIAYFDRPGPDNTDAVVQAVKTRCKELGIRHVVVASDSGATALKVWEALQGAGVTLLRFAKVMERELAKRRWQF